MNVILNLNVHVNVHASRHTNVQRISHDDTHVTDIMHVTSFLLHTRIDSCQSRDW